ncbi:MAG TPA: divalent metal cation transporter [Candidatus Angelobacter sp.]
MLYIAMGIVGAKHGITLLLFSRLILSIQLSFAVIPLVMFTGDKRKTGEFANAKWLKTLAWTVSILIVGLDGRLLIHSV